MSQDIVDREAIKRVLYRGPGSNWRHMVLQVMFLAQSRPIGKRRGAHFSAAMSPANAGPGMTANPSSTDVSTLLALSYSNDTALEPTVKCR